MLQTLIVCRSNKYLCRHLLTKYTIIQYFVPIFTETTFVLKCIGYGTTINFCKRCAITHTSHKTTKLSCYTLDKLSECHTTWNSMWINNNIWCYTIFSIRHISLWNNHTYNTLLSVSTSKFVT